ncbi:hypothetical protein ETD83_06970 [Actinomadura soli]|uniref:Uncharacterized protein n=1 Tax=Actinomadura soli TaxID=2508997 RepID=A0A5C4JHI7_9ACTN|nr:hypothetical protein [Actinomadura soli]TMR05037.1 hypothetical protein ETD83_06970 [Actinomadura soli]
MEEAVVEETDRCQGPQPRCSQLPTLEVMLGRLSDRSPLPPLRVCSQCGACILTVHGVWPEGAPSPYRVVRIRLLHQPAVRTPRVPSSPPRAPVPERAAARP